VRSVDLDVRDLLPSITTPLLASYGKTEIEVRKAIVTYRYRREQALANGRYCGLHPYDIDHPASSNSDYYISEAKAMNLEAYRDKKGRLLYRRAKPDEGGAGVWVPDGRKYFRIKYKDAPTKGT